MATPGQGRIQRRLAAILAAGMKRRDFITLVGGAAATWPFAARAQSKVHHIGILDTTSEVMNAANLTSFRRGLEGLGYRDGSDFVIDYRSADGFTERFAKLAAELVQLRVDVIVLRGTPAAVTVARATATIPVVFTAVGDPVDAGLIASLARPGRNVTGLSSFSPDLEGKRVELLREMVPRAARIAALMEEDNPAHTFEWKGIETAAQSVGIAPQLMKVRTIEDIERAFSLASAQHADGLVVGNSTLTQANRQFIVELADRYRLPAIFNTREFVDAGGLVAYGPSYPDLYRRAATYVDRILKGANPADLPVEQPTKFELVINLKTAKALGLTIPPMLLARADEVIE